MALIHRLSTMAQRAFLANPLLFLVESQMLALLLCNVWHHIFLASEVRTAVRSEVRKELRRIAEERRKRARKGSKE